MKISGNKPDNKLLLTPVEHKILLDERLKRVEEGKITYKNWNLLKKKYERKGV
jgi:hypothetical protein